MRAWHANWGDARAELRTASGADTIRRAQANIIGLSGCLGPRHIRTKLERSRAFGAKRLSPQLLSKCTHAVFLGRVPSAVVSTSSQNHTWATHSPCVIHLGCPRGSQDESGRKQFRARLLASVGGHGHLRVSHDQLASKEAEAKGPQGGLGLAVQALWALGRCRAKLLHQLIEDAAHFCYK